MGPVGFRCTRVTAEGQPVGGSEWGEAQDMGASLRGLGRMFTAGAGGRL